MAERAHVKPKAEGGGVGWVGVGGLGGAGGDKASQAGNRLCAW